MGNRNPVDGIILDIDGTLWDAVPGVTQAWQDEINRQGYHYQLEVETMRPLFGQVANVFGDTLFSDLSVEKRRALANDCMTGQVTKLRINRKVDIFPGVVETIRELSKKYPMFLVTNADDNYVQCLMDLTGTREYFTDSRDAGRSEYTKAENIRMLIDKYDLKHAVYVGDTSLDQKSTLEAGATFIWAAYGFDKSVKNDLELHHFADLPAMIEALS